MKVELFDFDLPESYISLRPLENRVDAKLLHLDKDANISDLKVADILQLLRPGDALVLNDTKVIPANLTAIRARLDEKSNDYKLASINVNLHMQEADGLWWAFVRPAKKIRQGETLMFLPNDYHESNLKYDDLSNFGLKAFVLEKKADGQVLLKFNRGGLDLNHALFKYGKMPLPPYISSRRRQDEKDKSDYQTAFAKYEGAVAAPTAGLHFTSELLEMIQKKDVKLCFCTLHVGAGTFLPVKVDDTNDHQMHSEIGYLSQEVANKLNEVKAKGGRIICVGTTALRLVESAANVSVPLRSWEGKTDIFITPGYEFLFVDCLITNFHLPKSTLFMLVCAFCGLENMKRAYNYAIEHNYRFYSYGDTSFLERITS